MAKFDLAKHKWLIFPALSGILLGISRLPLYLNFAAFFAFLPLFSLFDEGLKLKKLFIAGLIFGAVYNLVCLHWISLVTIPGYIGMFILLGLYFALLFLIKPFTSSSVDNLYLEDG